MLWQREWKFHFPKVECCHNVTWPMALQTRYLLVYTQAEKAKWGRKYSERGGQQKMYLQN